MSEEIDNLETDTLLTAIKDVMLAAETSPLKLLPEATAANVVIWHHGVTDPDEDLKAAMNKSKGVSFLIYDLGGDESAADSDSLSASIIIELYVDTTKRSRKVNPNLRLGGQIRDALMRKLHRHPDLRNKPQFYDCRVRGYSPLADDEFAAWRITLVRSFFLQVD